MRYALRTFLVAKCFRSKRSSERIHQVRCGPQLFWCCVYHPNILFVAIQCKVLPIRFHHRDACRCDPLHLLLLQQTDQGAYDHANAICDQTCHFIYKSLARACTEYLFTPE